MLRSSSHIQTYFSKTICCLWDVFPQLIQGPIWTALSGCQSGITFVNVVRVFFNLDTHTHLKSKLSWWSENHKYTYFTRKKVTKTLKNPKFYSCSCHLCGIHCGNITSKSALNSVLPNSISHNLFSAALWPSVSHYLLFLPFNVISVSFQT